MTNAATSMRTGSNATAAKARSSRNDAMVWAATVLWRSRMCSDTSSPHTLRSHVAAMGAATGAALREAVTEVRVIDAVTRLMGRSSSACELYAVGTLRVRVSVHIAWALADPAMLVVCTRLLAAAAAAGAGNIPDFLDAGTEVVPCRDGTHSFPRDLVAHCQEKLVRARDTLKRAETAYEDAIRRDEGDQELVGALRVARQEALEVARSIWRGVVGSMCTCSMHRIITRPSKL